MIFSLKSMTLLLKFMKTLNFVTLLLNSMIFPLKSLQSQKIFVKSHVAQNFFWRNLASQEGRMCEGGPLPLHALFAQALNGILLCEALCEAKT